jgi:hypothetical protein
MSVYCVDSSKTYTHKCSGVGKLNAWFRIVSNIGFHVSDVKRLRSATTDWVIYLGAQHFALHITSVQSELSS